MQHAPGFLKLVQDAKSRVREIASCTNVAASGARIITRIAPTAPSGWRFSESREPAKRKPKFASMPIAPAIVAATVMIKVSRFLMWASSWAITPASSSSGRVASRPVVTATAECCGSRPVAKAFGWSLWITYTAGMGRSARRASSATMFHKLGALARVTGCAWCRRSTILSEFHQAKAFIPRATSRATTRPPSPPIRNPAARKRAVIAARRSPVLTRFIAASRCESTLEGGLHRPVCKAPCLP